MPANTLAPFPFLVRKFMKIKIMGIRACAVKSNLDASSVRAQLGCFSFCLYCSRFHERRFSCVRGEGSICSIENRTEIVYIFYLARRLAGNLFLLIVCWLSTVPVPFKLRRTLPRVMCESSLASCTSKSSTDAITWQ